MPHRLKTWRPAGVLWLSLLLAAAAGAADADLDALALEGTEPAAAKAAPDTRAFIEAAAGTALRRDDQGSRGTGRLTLDGRHGGKLGEVARYALSARLDATDPADPRADNPVFSLREAFVGWQDTDAAYLLDFGRINLRSGPAYGYNPTEFFRDDALRTVTSANPFTLRENRLGTLMLRAQHLWADGSASIALAPRLANGPSRDGLSLDWGATNARDRAQLKLNTRWSSAFSSQVLLYKETGQGPVWGANATALLGDALTAHAEWSRGRETDLLARALSIPGDQVTRNRLALGVTYATATQLSLTAEVHYNGFALDRDAIKTLPLLDPAAAPAYFGTALTRQDNAARQAWLLYVTQRDLAVKNLELTALAKFNRTDSSRLFWLDLRYRLDGFDVALQLQRHLGDMNSEFGIAPVKGTAAVVVAAYF